MWHTNLERTTRTNRDWRRVLFTGDHLQVVLMSVPPGQELGWEVHDDTDQFFRVDGTAAGARGTVGKGTKNTNGAVGEGTKGTEGQVRTVQKNGKVNMVTLVDGTATAVRAGTWHNVVNTSKTTPLTFYTIYAPPHHPRGTRQKRRPKK